MLLTVLVCCIRRAIVLIKPRRGLTAIRSRCYADLLQSPFRLGRERQQRRHKATFTDCRKDVYYDFPTVVVDIKNKLFVFNKQFIFTYLLFPPAFSCILAVIYK